jgi:hypothetical protein
VAKLNTRKRKPSNAKSLMVREGFIYFSSDVEGLRLKVKCSLQ